MPCLPDIQSDWTRLLIARYLDAALKVATDGYNQTKAMIGLHPMEQLESQRDYWRNARSWTLWMMADICGDYKTLDTLEAACADDLP